MVANTAFDAGDWGKWTRKIYVQYISRSYKICIVIEQIIALS